MFEKNFISKKLSNYKRKIVSNEFRSLIPAAVLVSLVYRGNNLFLILTKRTEDVEHHKGQISFPGGRLDNSDTSLTNTALRECEEEVGLLPQNVEVVGMLDDLVVPSGYLITPIVALIKPQPWKINYAEVELVLEIKFEEFFNQDKFRVEKWERGGKLVDVCFYDVYKEPVWGATASIIRNFCKILSPAAQ